MFINEIYSEFQTGKHLFDTFAIQNGLKQRNASSPLIFNFALEYAIRNLIWKLTATKLKHC